MRSTRSDRRITLSAMSPIAAKLSPVAHGRNTAFSWSSVLRIQTKCTSSAADIPRVLLQLLIVTVSTFTDKELLSPVSLCNDDISTAKHL